MLGVSKNPDRIPEHERKENRHVQFKYTDDTKGDKESPKDCSSLKSYECFYTCPHAPTDDTKGDKESPKDCSSLKSYECFYTCPHAPFYRETKGLLHSENTPRTQGIFLV
jgi:hypothetical protein